jgi:hypothetical protein
MAPNHEMPLCEDCDWVCENHPIDHGTVNTPAAAAVPACHVQSAMRATKKRRHGHERLQNSIKQKRLASLKADKGWRRRFEDPIPLSRGRQLVTLQDAGNYITKLSRTEHATAEWQAAMESLLLVVEARPSRVFSHSLSSTDLPAGNPTSVLPLEADIARWTGHV